MRKFKKNWEKSKHFIRLKLYNYYKKFNIYKNKVLKYDKFIYENIEKTIEKKRMRINFKELSEFYKNKAMKTWKKV